MVEYWRGVVLHISVLDVAAGNLGFVVPPWTASESGEKRSLTSTREGSPLVCVHSVEMGYVKRGCRKENVA